MKSLQNEFFKIRLWDQKELVENMFLACTTHKLDEEIKSEIPLKQICFSN